MSVLKTLYHTNHIPSGPENTTHLVFPSLLNVRLGLDIRRKEIMYKSTHHSLNTYCVLGIALFNAHSKSMKWEESSSVYILDN